MDCNRLEQFRAFDDDALNMTRAIIALFVQDAPVHSTALAAALNARDSTALSQAAHALKGAALNIGASALSDASAALEVSYQDARWPFNADAQLANLVSLSDKTLAQLQIWQSSQPTQP